MRLRRRSGFTLVELLMVIVIIGMLVALVSVAAMKALATAQNAQITTEIGILTAAIQTYKNNSASAFPPDCSLLSTPASGTPTTGANSDVQNRQNRILAHFRKAFPRLVISGGYGSSSSPAAGTLQYMSINMYSQAATTYTTSGSTSTSFGSTKAPNGQSQWGDFDNLDPAEAYVFWLGGFAIPYQDQSGKWTFKLIGFAANKVGNASSAGPNASGSNSGFGPFNLDIQSRDNGPFQFDANRLGDADGDGWPEYYPPSSTVPQPLGGTAAVANPTPPYVYFDAVSYGYYTTPTSPAVYPTSAIYPSPSSPATPMQNVTPGLPGAQPKSYLAQWGTAVPYVQTLPSSGTMTWVQPQGFQIISAGLDQMYWFDPVAQYTNNQLRVFPAGTYLSEGDLDNLTSFTSSTLQNAQP